MTSSQINKALQSIFKKATIPSKITSTSFRKAAVTNVHEQNPELSSKLAGLMAHNESTAKKYYLLSEKTKASVEASTKLGQLMRGQNEDPCEQSENQQVTSDSTDNQQETLSTSKRVPWTNDKLEKVKASFEDEIREQNISLPAIRAKVSTSEQLKGMSPRRIYDKLKKGLPNDEKLDSNISSELRLDGRIMQQRLLSMVPDWLETTESVSHEEQLSASIVSPTERSGMFSDDAIQTIRTIFSDMILLNKPIAKPAIQKRCSETKDGKKLLSNLTIQQLVNRIKYERRKKREEQKYVYFQFTVTKKMADVHFIKIHCSRTSIRDEVVFFVTNVLYPQCILLKCRCCHPFRYGQLFQRLFLYLLYHRKHKCRVSTHCF